MATGRKETSGVFLFCCFLCTLDVCSGFCFTSPIAEELTEFKRLRQYCEFKSGSSTLRLLPGSGFFTTDCLDCKCKPEGLICCGFNYNVGTYNKEGCVQKTDGCKPIFVRAGNQSLDCFTGKPVDFGTPPVAHPDNFYSMRKGHLSNIQMTAALRAVTPSRSPRSLSSGLQNTKMSQSVPLQSHLRDILNDWMAKTRQPNWHTVTTVQQVPVATSAQQPVTYYTDGNPPQDADWLSWLFFLN